MKVSLTPELPQPHKSTLLVAFLAENSLDQTRDLLGLSPDSPAPVEKGKKRFWAEEGRMVLGIGMGTATTAEQYRRAAYQAVQFANEYGYSQLVLGGQELQENPSLIEAISESLLLSNYQFLVYKSTKKPNGLERAQLIATGDEALIAAIEGKQ